MVSWSQGRGAEIRRKGRGTLCPQHLTRGLTRGQHQEIFARLMTGEAKKGLTRGSSQKQRQWDLWDQSVLWGLVPRLNSKSQ